MSINDALPFTSVRSRRAGTPPTVVLDITQVAIQFRTAPSSSSYVGGTISSRALQRGCIGGLPSVEPHDRRG